MMSRGHCFVVAAAAVAVLGACRDELIAPEEGVASTLVAATIPPSYDVVAPDLGTLSFYFLRDMNPTFTVADDLRVFKGTGTWNLTPGEPADGVVIDATWGPIPGMTNGVLKVSLGGLEAGAVYEFWLRGANNPAGVGSASSPLKSLPGAPLDPAAPEATLEDPYRVRLRVEQPVPVPDPGLPTASIVGSPCWASGLSSRVCVPPHVGPVVVFSATMGVVSLMSDPPMHPLMTFTTFDGKTALASSLTHSASVGLQPNTSGTIDLPSWPEVNADPLAVNLPANRDLHGRSLVDATTGYAQMYSGKFYTYPIFMMPQPGASSGDDPPTKLELEDACIQPYEYFDMLGGTLVVDYFDPFPPPSPTQTWLELGDGLSFERKEVTGGGRVLFEPVLSFPSTANAISVRAMMSWSGMPPMQLGEDRWCSRLGTERLAVIGPSGGVVRFRDLTLMFPENALHYPHQVRITEVVPGIYDLEPSWLPLQQPVTIIVSYRAGDPDTLDPSDLALGYHVAAPDGGEDFIPLQSSALVVWRDSDGTERGGSLVGEIQHFSRPGKGRRSQSRRTLRTDIDCFGHLRSGTCPEAGTCVGDIGCGFAPCKSCLRHPGASGQSMFYCCLTCPPPAHEWCEDLKNDFPCEPFLGACSVWDYAIKANTCAEAEAQFKFEKGGVKYAAWTASNACVTDWEISITASSWEGDKWCARASAVMIAPAKSEQEVTLPNWVNAPPACMASWDDFVASLREHEQGHAGVVAYVCEELANTIAAQQSGKWCAAARGFAEDAARLAVRRKVEALEAKAAKAIQKVHDDWDALYPAPTYSCTCP
ncbi:MAG: DUF922 domain-containing protein [Deltaproteobacteria bacterium]|nr:DUF922 domain-containing protein [Deltaproteobacteria bacterium]